MKSKLPYRVEIEQESDGRWLAAIPQLPGVLAYAKKPAEAVRKATTLALRVLADTNDDVVKALDAAAGLDLDPHVQIVEAEWYYDSLWFDALIDKLRAMPLERLPAVVAAINGELCIVTPRGPYNKKSGPLARARARASGTALGYKPLPARVR